MLFLPHHGLMSGGSMGLNLKLIVMLDIIMFSTMMKRKLAGPACGTQAMSPFQVNYTNEICLKNRFHFGHLNHNTLIFKGSIELKA